MITCPICGEENMEGATCCSNCREPLEPVVETIQESSELKMGTLLLHDMRSEREIKICHSGIISREDSDFEPDFFHEDRYLSYPHCKIQFNDGQWTLEDLYSLNGTYINKNKVMPNFQEHLHNGDLLMLADLIFKVEIIEPSESDPSLIGGGMTDSPCEENLVWGIRCPICGTFFQVAHEASQIDSCPVCCDEMDKERIRFEHPQKVRRAICKLIESFIQ